MEKIVKFVECLIPVTACNLKCSYCYVIQRQKNSGEIPKLQYSIDHIGDALSKKRLGGCTYFSICGAGETLIPLDTILIVKKLLSIGHYVNITTNGTITKRIEELLQMLDSDEIKRLHFSFSFHYLELLRLNLIDVFFNNVKRVKSVGCSFIVQLNLCDEYIPHIEKIKSLCIENIGAMPQLAATRKENELSSDVEIMSDLEFDEYVHMGSQFESPLFDFTIKNFNKKRKEFCYAGLWTFTLNLATGNMRRCYACNKSYNIFEDISKPIPLSPIGTHCNSLFCMNSSHFMSLGVIPSLDTPSYAELRNRVLDNGDSWMNETMLNALSIKLSDSNSGDYSRYQVEKNYLIDRMHGLLAKAYYKLKG